MRKNTLILLLSLYSAVLCAQSNMSAPKSFYIYKEVIPPILTIKEGSVHFNDDDGNRLINANEVSHITFTIMNTGKGVANGCTVQVDGKGETSGLSYANQKLPKIEPGKSYDVSIPITASMYTKTGDASFTIEVDESNGFGAEPFQIKVGTRKFDSPFVEIVSYKIVSDGSTQLKKKQPFKLQVLLQNTDQGVAHDVKCKFEVPDNLFLQDGLVFQQFTELQPNERQMMEFELISNAKVPDDLSLSFQLSESYGKYAKNADIPLHFGQNISSGMTSIQVAGKDKDKIDITKGSLIADVDENIPTATKSNSNTFVVIIANENYQQVVSVPFALNDGSIFNEYCKKTLGIPSQHIHYVPNATGNNIKSEVNWLHDVISAFKGDAKVIFYYAGHGIPDEYDKSAYLLPIDGTPMDVSTGYKLDDLYESLGAMETRSITVLIDACFSGAKREDGMLASARGIALKARPGMPQGNMVVLTAAQGTETAYPYNDKQHGLFTYFLLKILQETKGDANLEDLGNYIIVNVTQQSVIQNSKPQTPSITPSSEVGTTWKSWTLK